MRFLIAISSLSHGSGLSRYVFSLCRVINNDNNNICILTTHNSGDNTYERKELDKIDPRISLISLGLKSKVAKYLSALSVIRKYKPDIIVNNYNAVVQYLLPFIAKKIKVVHILHNDTDDFYRIGSINGKYVDGWIAPTQAIADHFNTFTHNRFKGKVTVIPHGVETANFESRHNPKLVIVYAGVLYEHKGVKILPDIVHQLKEKIIDFRLTIIGGGILEDWLRNQLENDIKNGLVTMTGIIKHEEVYRLMSKADIFLYPTHLDAFGLVIAEAMMNGAVPVVTLLPGITDKIIDNGVDGFLLKQDDIDAFVSTIVKLYENKDLRNNMKGMAHKKAIDKFSLTTMERSYLKYINAL